jgi:hypothetical protein
MLLPLHQNNLLEPSGSVDNLLADDLESASEVTTPTLGQVHAITADDVESASEVTSPALGLVGGGTSSYWRDKRQPPQVILHDSIIRQDDELILKIIAEFLENVA